MEIKPGIYEHYKGLRYMVLGVAKDADNMNPTVVYVALYDNPEGNFWTRALSVFTENVEVAGALVPRFKFISEY